MTEKYAFGWTIPDDWEEERDGYLCYALCVPNSRGWRTVFDGQISALSYGRNWNKNTGTITEAQAVAREIYEHMCAAKCDDVLEQITTIAEAILVLVDQGATRGQAVESIPSDGQVGVGPGDEFPDQETYYDAKCNASNAIYDTILGMVTWFDANHVDLIAGGFGGVTSGILVGLALVGPVGWALALAGGLVTSLAGLLIGVALDFEDLQAAIEDTHDEVVEALYTAGNPAVAEDNFIAAVEASAQPISVAEVSLLRMMLTDDLLNQLFSPRDDVATYQSPDPVSCGAGATVWSFVASAEAWTFRDDSTANASATGSWDSAIEALSHLQIIDAGGSGRITRAIDVSPVLSVAVTGESSVQWDFDAVSDGIVVFREMTAFYGDTSEYKKSKPGHTGAGTLILNLTDVGTLVKIELETSRSNGQSTTGYNFTTKTLEVRLLP